MIAISMSALRQQAGSFSNPSFLFAKWTNTTGTYVRWGTVEAQVGTWVFTNSNEIIRPTLAGYYYINVALNQGGITGAREGRIVKNATIVVSGQSGGEGSQPNPMSLCAIVYLNGTSDTISIQGNIGYNGSIINGLVISYMSP